MKRQSRGFYPLSEVATTEFQTRIELGESALVTRFRRIEQTAFSY